MMQFKDDIRIQRQRRSHVHWARIWFVGAASELSAAITQSLFASLPDDIFMR